MKLKLAIILAGLLSLPSFAQAQVSFGDKEAPIFVKAEKATYQGTVTLLHENVDVKQGDAHIMSDRMEIHREQRSPEQDEVEGTVSLGAVTRIVAIGNFKYKTPETVVTGQQGTYYRDRGIIIVTGNVKVNQAGTSNFTGEKLIYDIANKRVRLDNNCERDNQGDNCDGERITFGTNNR